MVHHCFPSSYFVPKQFYSQYVDTHAVSSLFNLTCSPPVAHYTLLLSSTWQTSRQPTHGTRMKPSLPGNDSVLYSFVTAAATLSSFFTFSCNSLAHYKMSSLDDGSRTQCVAQSSHSGNVCVVRRGFQPRPRGKINSSAGLTCSKGSLRLRGQAKGESNISNVGDRQSSDKEAPKKLQLSHAHYIYLDLV